MNESIVESDTSIDNVEDSTNKVKEIIHSTDPGVLLIKSYESLVDTRIITKDFDTQDMETSSTPKYRLENTCDICNKVFTRKDSYISHLRVHTGEKPFKCDTCEKRFKDKLNLTRHMRTHTGDKPYPCALCGKNFTTKQALRRHNNNVYCAGTILDGGIEIPSNFAECNVDIKEEVDQELVTDTSIQNGINNEMVINANIKQEIKEELPDYEPQVIIIENKCEICHKVFNSRYNLKVHQIVHTGEKPFSCDSCDKTFTRKESLLQHKRLHTGENLFSCKTCSKPFIKKEHLARHEKIHTGEKPFPCDTCGKTFSQKNDLIRHERLHTGVKPFSCDTCGRGFSEKSKLKRHILTHNSEKPFACSICEKAFKHKDAMIKHEEMHNSDKPFSCVVCNKGFILKSGLSKHELIHTGEKPFQCEICKKSFSRKDYLTKHYTSIHGIESRSATNINNFVDYSEYMIQEVKELNDTEEGIKSNEEVLEHEKEQNFNNFIKKEIKEEVTEDLSAESYLKDKINIREEEMLFSNVKQEVKEEDVDFDPLFA